MSGAEELATYRLLVLEGPEAGLRFDLLEGRTRLGGSEECDIVLTGAGVAPRHCQVLLSGDGLRLESLVGSGTVLVNGHPRQEASLREGDRIALGSVELRVEGDTPSSDRPSGLIEASSAFHLLRSLYLLPAEAQSSITATIAVLFAGDLAGGELLVRAGGELADWRTLLATPLRALLEDALERGSASAPNAYLAVIPVRGKPAGLIGWSGHREAPEDALSALASFATAAWEASDEIQELRRHNTLLASEQNEATGIRGESPAVEQLRKMVAKAAPRDVTVLVLGESGTGKELVARAMHQLSPRARAPFVAMNCAAFTETLLESELFGHEKGSFTGATEQRLGKLELAAGGTVFLDEIGEMALSLQAKLLRVLQNRECERVGGRKTIKLDIRVVAATNRDLVKEAAAGRFREDLYHRLNVVAIRTPALRERSGDVPVLAEYFLEKAAARCGRRVEGFSPKALEALTRYDWPGNIRELENAIERAVVLGDTERVELEDLPDTLVEMVIGHSGLDDAPVFHQKLGEAKAGAIRDAWREAGGDYKVAAARLGVHPNSLLRMIRRLGLRKELQTD